ncbi:MAG: bifunctional adenosylcobinamide kinase/adenosylcobinamide-phosphate guanylyltransferase [Pseudomonadota bacterium]|nr:bifunctional adenosylcobinamide kinase/adenosylcobinamide-phosphate guanylyltransferase [Pseudomonadota bacterium]
MAKITFILGGARSGKSSYAEQLARQIRRPRIYIATAEALDEEMQVRIAEHRRRRGDDWTTLEVPLAIAEIIQNPSHKKSLILVDCLTLWLSNLMRHGLDITAQSQALTEALQSTQARVILVSNEVGQGIVPDNPLARRFIDRTGILHQQVAAVAGRVVWVAAGVPTIIKGK